MCDHAHAAPRAISLDHGRDHDRDHAAWTRRDFLLRSSAAVAGGSMLLGSTPVRALGHAPLLDHLARIETDRVLVLLQLGGGNDGLNTVVPVTNDLYYQQRPTIAIPGSQTISLGDDYGLHPSFGPLEPTWGEGQMAVVHSVGYPDPNLSHFRSTDIWLTASDSEETLLTGWGGRYLDDAFPDFETDPPTFPPAVQIGTSAPLLFQGGGMNLGMSLVDINLFLQIAQGGTPYDPIDVPPLPYGDELAFVRTVANDSFRYLDAIQAATDAADNEVEYPGGPLAQSLAACARLIKGRLGARIYHVTLGGFDTHADQPGQHANLLGSLAASVRAFYEDLAASDDDARVLTTTFSEFGRRIAQNGSDGTDHGTAAPLFTFGPAVAGGLYGDGPDLVATDADGNLVHTTDFRSVYATLLTDWFGLAPATVEGILGGPFGTVPFVASPVATGDGAVPLAFGLDAAYPNPFRDATTVTFRLSRPGDVRLRVYDTAGRLVATLAEGSFPAGTHTVRFDAGRLPSGSYHGVLDSAEGRRSRTMTLVR